MLLVASSVVTGTSISSKVFRVESGPSFVQNNTASSNIFTIGTHTIQTGEKVRVFSDEGDLPENIESNTVYFAIKISSTEIKLASSVTNAQQCCYHGIWWHKIICRESCIR